MEDRGIIAGYTVRVNRKKLGMEIRAYCNVTLKLHERELLEEFENNIGRHREVRSCYHLTGAFDYLVEVEVPNMDAYHRFITQRLAAMPNMTVQSMFVMKDVMEMSQLSMAAMPGSNLPSRTSSMAPPPVLT